MSYRFIVSGKVQGVYYRKHIFEAATKEGFKGYVKNLSNGDVEAACNCQDEKELEKFIDILKKGSPASRVEDIKIEKTDEVFDNFEIRY